MYFFKRLTAVNESCVLSILLFCHPTYFSNYLGLINFILSRVKQALTFKAATKWFQPISSVLAQSSHCSVQVYLLLQGFDETCAHKEF